MTYSKTYRPFLFYTLSIVIPWTLWFLTAYISHRPDAAAHQTAQASLGLAGLFAPALIGAWLLRQNPQHWADAKSRLFRITGFPKIYLVAAALLCPIALVIAQIISLVFGHSLEQFRITGSPSFTFALFSPWFMLIIAPIAEELAWHSYGTDALTERFSLFASSMLFSLFWAFWHLPLAFVKGYYQSQVLAEGAIYTANFVLSLFAFVLLMNWFYAKSQRSILIAIVFHLCANLGNEIFATHPDSKVIQTVILFGITLWVLAKDKDLFFQKTF